MRQFIFSSDLGRVVHARASVKRQSSEMLEIKEGSPRSQSRACLFSNLARFAQMTEKNRSK